MTHSANTSILYTLSLGQKISLLVFIETLLFLTRISLLTDKCPH